jgi:hypothetical protein
MARAIMSNLKSGMEAVKKAESMPPKNHKSEIDHSGFEINILSTANSKLQTGAFLIKF